MNFSSVFLVIAGAGWLLSLRCYAVSQVAQDNEALYISFEMPGSTNTYPRSINSVLSVTGYYSDAAGRLHGFVRDTWGRSTSFDPAGSKSTWAQSINVEGSITGYYTDQNNVQHGFVRSPCGALTSFDPLGSIETWALSINAAGTIAGYYELLGAGNYHSFVRDPQGIITTFDPPGCAVSQANSINAAGALTGYAQCGGIIAKIGFLRDSYGTFSTFYAPHGGAGTYPLAINSKGFIAGYSRGGGLRFVRSPDCNFTEFDVGADGYFPLNDTSINSGGAIAGTGGPVSAHGYVRSPQGTITTFEFPGAGATVADIPGSRATVAISINDFGVITGYYTSGACCGLAVGFLRIPYFGHGPDSFRPGTYTLADGNNLYVDGGFYLYGDPTVRLWVYVAGNPSQRWTFTKVSGGFTMLNQGTAQYACDIGGQLTECHNPDIWTVSPAPGGYTLENNRTALVLTDPAVQNGAVTLTRNGSVWQMSTSR
jgi:hypothetical protein